MGHRVDPIDEILAIHKLKGPWAPMPDTGLANRIYATRDVVIRVAREHSEAIRDARTEAIAAPVAYAAGLLSPRLLAFDDSGSLTEGPYSIWERVPGETLGLIDSSPTRFPNTWRQVGQQLAQLHANVKPFADPQGHLHHPARNRDLLALLERASLQGLIDKPAEALIRELVHELQDALSEDSEICFLHSDVHAMNIMCTTGDELLALIDWGDSGWGDPTFDFAQIPLDAMQLVVEGYSDISSSLTHRTLAKLNIWDRIDRGLEWLCANRQVELPLDSYRRFLALHRR